MPLYADKPAVAFLFHPEHVSAAVLEAFLSTGATPIFDLTGADPATINRTMLPVQSTGLPVELKLSANLLLHPTLPDVLKKINVKAVWLELHEGLGFHLDQILIKLAELSDEFSLIPVTGSLPLIRRLIDSSSNIRLLALKGNEASGFVGSETIFTLFATLYPMLQDQPQAPGLAVWGGLALPEAAAAFLATGAQVVIFESLHWLTNLFSASADFKNKIHSLHPEHSQLVGLSLGLPYRLYNKGNSMAARELTVLADSLCSSEITVAEQMEFYDFIQHRLTPAHLGSFGRDELLPVGIEACFASSFVKNYGSETETALTGFIQEINRCLAQSTKVLDAFLNTPVTGELGVAFPFIQGAMSWITDNPLFAGRIARAGGLPTIALGMMDKELIEGKLSNLPQIMADFPYAVNLIALDENPFRADQVDWIKRLRPPFAVIAAGEPARAAELLAAGIETFYIPANIDLLQLAAAKGAKYIICEGNEAGGHVGNYSTITWAQQVLDLKRRHPDLFKNCRIILAGGICNRLTAFMAAMLGADAIQMGTVYLAVADITATGSLAPLYQQMIVESEPGSTLITGETTGLRVRSLNTPVITKINSLEQDLVAKQENAAELRRQIEDYSAGSLRIAARGTTKQGSLLDEETCLQQGQFMSGAAAGIIKTIKSAAELHQELATGPLPAGLPFTGPIGQPAMPSKGRRADRVAVPEKIGQSIERIAITGMSMVNSLGDSPAAVWSASLNMKSGVSLIPSHRWDHDLFYHPRPGMTEKTYCRVGAFQNLKLDRQDIDVPPQDFRTMTDSTKITLWLASQAILDSGLLHADIPPERIAVLISQNSGEAAATLQDVIIRTSISQIMSAVNRAAFLTPELQTAVAQELKSGRMAIDDTTLLGRLNCAAAGFICNKYGFMGPSFSVSAACATSLVALFSAYQMIRTGIIDAAVVGGAEEFLTPMHFLEFSALGALAGLSGNGTTPTSASRPFDKDRDGMVLGEGGGLIIIERESVARQRNANIFAYINSMGASNNHLGMVESSRSTQEIALRTSLRDLPYGPESIDLVECHATSTRQGDVEEILALKSFFQSAGKTVLTSFKSQIGHTLGASGLNSLIRGVMAMNAGIFPPTLNYLQPDPEMGLNGSGLRILPQPDDWPLNHQGRRRLQVNAFGFGGSNYVVQLEQANHDQGVVLVSPGRPEPAELPSDLSFFKTRIAGESYRLAVRTESAESALEKIGRMPRLKNKRHVSAKLLKSLSRQGIHLAPEQSPPQLAYVFPGQGSYYAGMSHELYQTFPVIRRWLDNAAAVADFDLLDLMFYDRNEDLQKTRWQQPALFAMEYAMAQYLWSLGIRPTALAGHSLGELTALCLAGVYSFEDGFRIVNKRAVCMDRVCTMNVDPGVMMAVDAPLEVLQNLLPKIPDVFITNLNSPSQIVIGGNSAAVNSLGAELQTLGYRTTLLPVSMAFHSPLMHCIHDELEAFIAGIELHSPRLPVISNTTTMPFPDEPDLIRGIIMAHLESPVNWLTNVQTLWHDFGIRLFVEIGPREILSNLIQDTIGDATCLATCLPSAEALVFRTALAQLYVHGNLPVSDPAGFVSLAGAAESGEPVQADVSNAPAKLPPAPGPALKAIIEQQIGSYVRSGSGRSLKSQILEAVSTYQPSLSEENLEWILHFMFPDPTMKPSAAPTPISRSELVETLPEQPLSPLPSGTDNFGDVTEAVIQILMAVTGYERHEMDPGMDLRDDLAIRSSRLPVIIDALENRFGLNMEFTYFRDVRTIRDVADKISLLLSDDTSMGLPQKPLVIVKTAETSDAPVDATAPKIPIKRVVFEKIVSQSRDMEPVELTHMDSVAVWSPVQSADLRRQVEAVLRRDYGCSILPRAFDSGGQADAVDLRTAAGLETAITDMQESYSLAGLVIVLDNNFLAGIDTVADVASWLTGFFGLLQTFLASTAKKFFLLIDFSEPNQKFGSPLTEGLLGLFLSAVQEFPEMLFRRVSVQGHSEIRDVVRGALDRSRACTEIIFENGQVLHFAGKAAPIVPSGRPHLNIGPDDVILFTGGCSGIVPFLAQALVPCGCKMAFLGRTPLEPYLKFISLKTGKNGTGELLGGIVNKGSAIVKTIDQLKAAGIEAQYFAGDVSDPQGIASVMHSIRAQLGQITGVVHGAGILRDKTLKDMTTADFSSVVEVKLLGAWHLLQETLPSLKFFTCLSSAACIQGNPGQANYACANRAMSALLSCFHELNPGLVLKAFMLPPVAGAGMADNPDIKAFMKLVKTSYINLAELADLFSRELFFGSPQNIWVLFLRSLPHLDNVCLRLDADNDGDTLQSDYLKYSPKNFPMIDAILGNTGTASEITVTRSFDPDRDVWISDHKPFKFLKHPLVSAIMALECFLETAKLLHPNLQPRGVKEVRFLDFIECPAGLPRESQVQCRTTVWCATEVVCAASMVTRNRLPSQKVAEIKTNFEASVLLGPTPGKPVALADFPVRPEELDSRPMEPEEVLEWYQNRSDLQNRYRVIMRLDGTGPGAIRGRMIYRRHDDFKAAAANYQYPPYLLEALIQATSFYVVMRNPSEQRVMVPLSIEEMLFGRQCTDQEELVVEARLREQNEIALTWDARGLDTAGNVVMIVKNLKMGWFYD